MTSLTTPFRDLLPPLSTQEKEALRASIELDGLREPIVIDELDQVLDGHHRLEIAPDAARRVVSGLTDTEKRAFVYQVNFARRNMSPDQKREQLKKMKAIAKQLREEDIQKNTQARIAALLGVTQKTISEWLTEAMPNIPGYIRHIPDSRVKINPSIKPILVERAEAGESQTQIAADLGVNQSAISRAINSERKQQKVRREREELVTQIGDVGIKHGDFREFGKALADNSIDLILTDPPYDKSAIPLYGALAELAARVLRPGGWCLAYSGHTWLPDVIAEMSKHLAYGWMFAIQHSGGDLRYRTLKLQNNWKPVLGFYKAPLNVWWDWFSDSVTGGKEKSDHEWQQSVAESLHYIRALCPLGGVVLDPMAGSGTVGIAASAAKRQWIGFEANAETCANAALRLTEATANLQ